MLFSPIVFYTVALLMSVLQNAPQVCHPAVADIRFDGAHNPTISQRMQALYEADQAERDPNGRLDASTLIENDRLRREEVIGYLQAGQIYEPTQLYQAALIFQHGDCPAHFLLAADLTRRAHDLGHPNAGWLHAAATDRYLLQTGRLQRYGTRYVTDTQGHFALCPVAPEISDEERADYGLPTLAELQARTEEFNRIIEIPPHSFARLGRTPILGWFVNQLVVIWNCFY